MTQLSIAGLYYYPIKSCAGIALEEAVLDEKGITHDREFMVVDASGKQVTQRENPGMTRATQLIKATTLQSGWGRTCKEITDWCEWLRIINAESIKNTRDQTTMSDLQTAIPSSSFRKSHWTI
ncbi:MOSC N-terminal beta barrel domain-containing protein [Candidatus Woesearchaeota archaeon]|nr:MOSC N-terminal beta barrel domain-containing protein [Candidatus Woesearchaeota archaeon]